MVSLGFPVHSGSLQGPSTVADEEPQIITWLTSISSVDLEIVIYFQLQNTGIQSHDSLRITNLTTLVCILLEFFCTLTLLCPYPCIILYLFLSINSTLFLPLTICLRKLSIAKIIAACPSFSPARCECAYASAPLLWENGLLH